MLTLTHENLAVLLTGKSLSELSSIAGSLGSADQVSFAAINRKDHIEKNVLDAIGRKIDIWCILSPPEFLRELGNTRLFLAEERSNILLTSSSALGSVIDLVRYRPLPGHEKILLLDDWIYNIYDYYYARTRKKLNDIFELTGEISTLFIFLHFIASLQFFRNIFLFGCDGVAAGKTALNSDIYFQQDTYTQARLEESGLHRDMLNFESEWKNCVDSLLLARGMKMPSIINANVQSHYTVFEKRTLAAVIADIKALTPFDGGCALEISGYPSWKDLLDRVDSEIFLHRFRTRSKS